MKRFYDRNKVWLEGTNLSTDRPMKKLDNKHFGPFKVIKKVGTSSYKLQIPHTWKSIHSVFNEALLTPYHKPQFPTNPKTRVHHLCWKEPNQTGKLRKWLIPASTAEASNTRSIGRVMSHTNRHGNRHAISKMPTKPSVIFTNNFQTSRSHLCLLALKFPCRNFYHIYSGPCHSPIPNLSTSCYPLKPSWSNSGAE